MRHSYFILTLGLAACATNSAANMPSYFLDNSIEVGMAQVVAEACTSIKMKDGVAEARHTAVAEQLVRDGHNADDLTTWLASSAYQEQATTRTESYYEAHGVAPDTNLGESGEDACRIGEEEITAESRIGTLLEKV